VVFFFLPVRQVGAHSHPKLSRLKVIVLAAKKVLFAPL